MKLTVLGSRAALPDAHDACSGYLVTETQTRILIDCGNGVASSLQSLGSIDPGETTGMTWGSVPPEESSLGAEPAPIDWGLDAIVISHLHPDHYLDLVPLRYGTRYRKKGRGRINVWVPPGGIEHLRRLGACLSTAQPFFERAFAFHEYAPDSPFIIGTMTLAAVPVWHSIPSHALRVVAAERTLVFSSDTAPCARLDEVATGADLLLAETTLGTEAYAPGGQLHLGGPDAGRVARVANARRLALTHFIPGTDREAVRHSAMREFDGVVKIVRPHLVMTV